ncbi:putative damage-inducible protein DinB [Streptacidiphilus sp. MAP12-16]|uniref:mycothiol transferase n=1 Tax=Streptacidiphilus sp. MAP12-16 TaxID=3156300 RepID=UPI003518E73F
MPASVDLLTDAFGRVRETVHQVLRGLSLDDLAFRLDRDANSIGWLVWHLSRIQDDHVADAAGMEQVWTAQGWFEQFALPFPAGATGYGHKGDEVAALRGVPARSLATYYDAVHEQTIAYLGGLQDADLDRVVDTRWQPPVTLGVRLVSVISDDLQHAGQASLVRGVLRRRARPA